MKFEDPNNPGTYLAGELVNEDYGEFVKGQLIIYSQADGDARIGFDSTGKWVSASANPNLPEMFVNACVLAGLEATGYVQIFPGWQIGYTIQNWGDYRLV